MIWVFETGHWENPQKFQVGKMYGHFIWAPNSQMMAVQALAGDTAVFLLKLDGTIQPLIARNEVFPDRELNAEYDFLDDFGPTWSPDSKQIFYEGYMVQDVRILDLASGERTIFDNTNWKGEVSVKVHSGPPMEKKWCYMGDTRSGYSIFHPGH